MFPIQLLPQREGSVAGVPSHGAVLSVRFRGVAGKPVGKPDALVGHVRFDERGRETDRLPVGSDLAPFLDSTPRSQQWSAGKHQETRKFSGSEAAADLGFLSLEGV